MSSVARELSHLLHLEDLYKSYGDKLVLENIDLSVSAGTLCSVVGPSGCGKSTLFRLVLGQETPDSGRLFVDGNPVGGPGDDRGIVYQRYSLYPHLTVIENAMLARTLPVGFLERHRRRAEFREEAMHYLERAGLPASVSPILFGPSGMEVELARGETPSVIVETAPERLATLLSAEERLTQAQVDRIVALLDPRQPLPRLAQATPGG